MPGMTERQFKQYKTTITKAITKVEAPVKEKHARNTIIGTFFDSGGISFWVCVQQLSLQENQIIAWKFCHLLHKVLREGHAQMLPDSQQHRENIQNLGRVWYQPEEGRGKLISQYCQLLITKLDFHHHYPRFPGNLQVTKEQLGSIGENDINIYFQISAEMFDYLDGILILQAKIFDYLNMKKLDSITSYGQCWLAPLIPCIQDSSQLYDCCVKILYKLHAGLPMDNLLGHRARFLNQFHGLKQFYLNTNVMEYFKNFIGIPLLPDTPPNFVDQSYLQDHVTPVITLPSKNVINRSQSERTLNGSLTGTSDYGSTGECPDLDHNMASTYRDVLNERNNLIDHLQQEIRRLKTELQRLVMEHQRIVEELKERILELETELATKDSELLQERQLKDDILQQTDDVSKYQQSQKMAEISEDKFQKLKEIYAKLREEHIQLIQQKAAVDKQLGNKPSVSEEADGSKVEVESKLLEILHEKLRVQEQLQKSSNESKAELIAVKAAHDAIKNEKLALALKMHWVMNEKNILEGEVQDLLAEKVDHDAQLREIQDRMHGLEHQMQQKYLVRIYQLLVACVSQAETIVQKSIHEVDNPALLIVFCTPEYLQSLAHPIVRSLDELDDSFHKFNKDGSSLDDLVQSVTHISHLIANYLVQGKITSNTSPDIEFGEHIAAVCKTVGNECLALLGSLKDRRQANIVAGNIRRVQIMVTEVAKLVARLNGTIKKDSIEIIRDKVKELAILDKSIEADRGH